MSEKKVHVEVWFEGRVTIAVDPSRYPHYFSNDEARGGLSELTRDLFFDHASLRGEPFVADSSEFRNAAFGEPNAMPLIDAGPDDELVVPLAGDVLASIVALQNRGDDRDHNFVMFIREVREDIVALQEPLSHIDSAVRFPKADKDQIILTRVRELSVMLGDLIRKVNR